MQKLSVAIITYNEEANIAACIESIHKLADEIIVVDSYSTDHTVEIAKKLGANVILNKFEGHIQQKNFAFSKCTYPFILSLDADERLDEQAINSIFVQKENGFPYDGYIIRRSSFIGNKNIRYGSWYPDKKLRLVKKDLATWGGINPHDKLILQSTNIFTLIGNILHYSYKNVEELFEKSKKYAEISARHLFSLNRKISPLFIYVKAWARFIKHYFIKLGFLDGGFGWQIGKQQYYEALWKYKGLAALNKKVKAF